jgi:hypothetical protein
MFSLRRGLVNLKGVYSQYWNENGLKLAILPKIFEFCQKDEAHFTFMSTYCTGAKSICSTSKGPCGQYFSSFPPGRVGPLKGLNSHPLSVSSYPYLTAIIPSNCCLIANWNQNHGNDSKFLMMIMLLFLTVMQALTCPFFASVEEDCQFLSSFETTLYHEIDTSLKNLKCESTQFWND